MLRCALTKPNEKLEISSADIPTAPKNGILIKVLYSGICQSDLKLNTGSVSLGDGKTLDYLQVIGEEGYRGIVPGHEICGEVLEVGEDARKSCPHKVGDKVVVYPWTGCRQCELCTADLYQSCCNNKVTTTDIGRGYNGTKHGGFQNYFPLDDWKFALRLPEPIAPEIGCMMPCSTLTTYTSVQKCRPPLQLGIRQRGHGKLLIIGLGGLGAWALILAKTIFGERVKVTCADVVEEKLIFAKGMGADSTILMSTKDSMDEMTMRFTVAGKYDACIDIVGLPITLEACFWSVQNGGLIVPLGLGGGKLAVATPSLIGRSITICGNRTGSIGDLRELMELLANKGLYTLPPTEFVTLDQVNDVFNRMKSGTVKGRAIIKF